MTENGAAAGDSTLHMMRANINLRELHKWMGSRSLRDTDRACHALLAGSFGDQAPKPFRLITPRQTNTGTLYGYGKTSSAHLRDTHHIFADPLQARVLPSDSINTKPMPTTWKPGSTIGFEVRVRPIIRRSQQEIDAFIAAKDQQPPNTGALDRESVYIEWLANQFERIGGALIHKQQTQLQAFQRKLAIYRAGTRGKEGPDAVIRGVLTITQSDAFARLLARGIGRHRAYGYGMVLLRPTHRQ